MNTSQALAIKTMKRTHSLTDNERFSEIQGDQRSHACSSKRNNTKSGSSNNACSESLCETHSLQRCNGEPKVLNVHGDLAVVQCRRPASIEKLMSMVNYQREQVILCTVGESTFAPIRAFSIKHGIPGTDPTIEVFSCSLSSDKRFALLGVEISKRTNYVKSSECFIAHFNISTGQELGRYALNSPLINPCAVFHRQNPYAFYTVTQDQIDSKPHLSMVSTKTWRVKKQMNVNLDPSDCELALTLDISLDGEFIIIQALEPDFDPNEYLSKVLIHDSSSLECLKQFTPTIVEPCHAQCLMNYRPRFVSHGRTFESTFPHAFIDNTFGDANQNKDIYKSGTSVVYKIPVTISLKQQARAAVLANLCCDEAVNDLCIPRDLQHFLKYK